MTRGGGVGVQNSGAGGGRGNDGEVVWCACLCCGELPVAGKASIRVESSRISCVGEKPLTFGPDRGVGLNKSDDRRGASSLGLGALFASDAVSMRGG